VPVKKNNKKAVLPAPQGNRTMPQVFFSVEVRQQHSLQVRLAKLRKPRFRAPNMLAQNTINKKSGFKVIQSHVFGVSGTSS